MKRLRLRQVKKIPQLTCKLCLEPCNLVYMNLSALVTIYNVLVHTILLLSDEVPTLTSEVQATSCWYPQVCIILSVIHLCKGFLSTQETCPVKSFWFPPGLQKDYHRSLCPPSLWEIHGPFLTFPLGTMLFQDEASMANGWFYFEKHVLGFTNWNMQLFLLLFWQWILEQNLSSLLCLYACCLAEDWAQRKCS